MDYLFKERKYSWFQSFCIRVLKAGSVPKHVAFIMDGNRRFACKHKIKKIEGHRMGYNRMIEVIGLCKDLGIKHVTTYAFSIDNFKRSKEEVDGLMYLFQESFKNLLDKRDKLNEHGLCVRVFGNLKMLPKDLQNLIAQVVLLTQNNKETSLNLCLAYTSQEEICQAINQLAEGVDKGLIELMDISELVFEECLYSAHEQPPELLVRTSGEVRLSNFLLWQCSYSVLLFLKSLWPELTFWHMCFVILYYQLNHQNPEMYEQLAREENSKREEEFDWQMMLLEIEPKDRSEMANGQMANKRLSNFKKRKEKRISSFLRYLEDKRQQQFKDMISGC